ncbi:type II toxin-antitoxin system ParD family antitoxin [Glutamicibacter sp. MNS18]
MAADTSRGVDDHCADFLAEQVNTGRYRSASEAVRRFAFVDARNS